MPALPHVDPGPPTTADDSIEAAGEVLLLFLIVFLIVPIAFIAVIVLVFTAMNWLGVG